jgi:hypothetical protein
MFPAAAEITAPPPPLPRIAHTVDVVVAAGLGERGPAPRPPSAPVPSMPSLPPPVGTVPSSSGANQPQTFPFPRSGPATPATDTREVSADSAPYALTVDGGVPTVDEAHATRELSRPARLVLDGWLVDDALVVGNHEGADIRVPELRAFEEQAFLWLDYFRIELSDGSPTVTLLQPGEARLTADGVEVERAEGAGAALYVARRDASLDVGFEVALRLVKDAALGGHLLAVDTVPRAVAGLFTIGLEPRTARDVRFDTAGTVRASLVFDGAGVRVRSAEGGPLRASRVGARFRPLAMSGTEGAVLLCRGDRLQVGRAVYRVEVG